MQFRFADRIDLILMFVAICVTIGATCGIVSSIVLFSRLAASFIIESYGNNCSQQEQNPILNNITCPLDIHLNPDKYIHLQK